MKPGEDYMDNQGVLWPATASTPPEKVDLQPIYFDADVEIDYVTTGAVGGRVPSRGMLGYVQLSPRGVPLSAELFSQLLNSQFGAIGGPVDFVIHIGKSHQPMRLRRAGLHTPPDNARNHTFSRAARGAAVLPPNGSSS